MHAELKARRGGEKKAIKMLQAEAALCCEILEIRES